MNFIIAQSEPRRPLSSELKADTIWVDIQQSQIEWIGRKLTGEHSGNMRLKEGWVTMNGSTLIGGKFIFDMTSIINTDIESLDWSMKLTNHLKSSDFFNVDSFPLAILEIKKNDSIAEESNSGHSYMVSADLTIRDITHEISFPYRLEKSDSTLSAIGWVDVDRTLYNIKYNSGTYFFDLGDKIIYDDFKIKFIVHTMLY